MGITNTGITKPQTTLVLIHMYGPFSPTFV